MTANAKSLSAATISNLESRIDWFTPPATTEECLLRIDLLGQRISEYVRFMCAVGSLESTSEEAKQKAVRGFYDRLAVFAKQLGRIHDDLRLG
jgi:hypothetical protein